MITNELDRPDNRGTDRETQTEDKIQQLRLAQLYIVQEIKRICDKHNIKYFLDCGSMLGAVRHHGFIPWDDDMDVGMLKDDYDKFIRIAPEELSSEFYFDEWHNNPKCPKSYAKLRLKGTRYLERKGSHNTENIGIFVDIFQYFPWPIKNRIKKTIDSTLLSMACHGISAKLGVHAWAGDGLKTTIRFLPTRVVGRMLPLNVLRKIVDYYYNRYTDYSQCTLLDGTRRNLIYYSLPGAYLSETIDMSFEGIELPVPKEYDKVLRLGYGDYMTIPPENERQTHHIEELDFGSYRFVKEENRVCLISQ